MTCKETLEFAANIAAILTFLGGAGAWCYYQYGFCHKRKVLEKHLKEEREADKKLGKQGARSFLHLTTKLGLTETDILRASFNNCHIKRLERLDEKGFAEKILFQYHNDNSN